MLFSSFEKLQCLHKLQQRFKIGSKIPSYQGHIFPFLWKYYQIWPTNNSLLSRYKLWFSKGSLESDSWRWSQYAPSPVHSSVHQTEYSLFSPSSSSLSWNCRNWTGLFFCKQSFQSLRWHQAKITSGSAIPAWSLTPVCYCLPGLMHTATEAPQENLGAKCRDLKRLLLELFNAWAAPHLKKKKENFKNCKKTPFIEANCS